MDKRCITATFEIVTPMFLGDGDQEARIIRPQSFKAELLFWWRALHYAGYVERAVGSETKVNTELNSEALANLQKRALNEMLKDETLLFGGADRQAAFLMKVEHEESADRSFNTLERGKVLLQSGALASPALEDNNGHCNNGIVGHGARYLAYGVMEAVSSRRDRNLGWTSANMKSYAGQLLRSAVEPNQKFLVDIIFRRDELDIPSGRARAQEGELLRALKLTGLLGGLGSRKRRGFGSIAMTEMTVRGIETEAYSAPTDQADYTAKLKSRIGVRTSSGKDFLLSAFASETDVRIWNSPKGDAMSALEAVGKEFLQYRGWGKGGKVAGALRRENFKTDHHWYRKEDTFADQEWADRTDNNIPERAIFGLPHNYGKDLGIAATGDKTSRRASPLLFHIAKVGSNYRPVATYFDTQFLPKNEISLNSRSALAYVPNAAVIRDFLDGKSRSAPPKAQIPPALFTKVLP